MPVGAIGRVERRRVDHPDDVDDKPREVILRQPVPDIRRHQERLLTITRDEVLRHPGIVLNPPDSRTFVRQPRVEALATTTEQRG
jgi:hypothetical protein